MDAITSNSWHWLLPIHMTGADLMEGKMTLEKLANLHEEDHQVRPIRGYTSGWACLESDVYSWCYKLRHVCICNTNAQGCLMLLAHRQFFLRE